MSKYEVVMIRHGESEWNQKNLFCGWFDSDLSDAGRAEAEAAGKALKSEFFKKSKSFASLWVEPGTSKTKRNLRCSSKLNQNTVR